MLALALIISLSVHIWVRMNAKATEVHAKFMCLTTALIQHISIFSIRSD